MKFSAVLSILALGGRAQAKVHQEAEQLEKSFERAVGEAKRDLHECCEWVCPEPEPEYYYRSKAMMMSGSGYGSYYGRRANEAAVTKVDEQGRKLWYAHESDCSWDCSACEEPDYDYDGYMCFPTVTTPDDCECTCCGFLPEPEEPEEPCYYRSKAMMMGGSWYDDDGVECGYRSKGMMGYSRRTKETAQGKRALPGKGWGGGWGGLTCNCECDVPEARSKGMMSGSGSMKSSKTSGSMDKYSYGY
jgi:hypothetical protein